MNLQYKINLTSLSILVVVTLTLAGAGVMAITRLSNDLNTRLMTKEIVALQRSIKTAIAILEQSGVAEVSGYQQRARADVISEFSRYSFGETGKLIVVDKKSGQVLLNGPSSTPDKQFLTGIVQEGSGNIIHRYGGESRFFFYGGDNEWDWLLILSERTDEVFKVRRRFVEIVSIIMVAGLGTGSILLLWSTSRIVRPIRLLAQAADALSDGRWQTNIPTVSGRDEIARLTDSFRIMAERLATTYSDLKENIRKIEKSQDELSTEKERLAITLRSIGDGIISTDQEGNITLLNRRAEELTGWDQGEALTQPLAKIFTLLDPQNADTAFDPVQPVMNLETQGTFRKQVTLVSRNHDHRTISVSGAPIFGSGTDKLGIIFVFRDMTEFLKMQEELMKSHKLESVGILAGGIAHDFNNILTGILGNLSLAKLSVQPQDPLHMQLDNAERATLRARDLTQQLLTFSKGGEPIKKLVNLSSTIKESASFALAGSNCSCTFQLAPDLWSTEADEGQISQVIHNLVINAKQSMPDGGEVIVDAVNMVLSDDDPLLAKAGNYLKISVTDRGCGIGEQDLTRIFDPYYSTKEGGSGLGLASAYSIVVKHSGKLQVKSRLNEGSVFEVYLPASEHTAPAEPGEHTELSVGSGRVLVLDDEQLVREVAGTMLNALGYTADFADDGKVAIEKYRSAMEHGSKYDMVIMDLTIPGGMGGEEAMQTLLECDPDIVAIVSSGYANDPIMANFRDHGFTAVLSKPFSLDQLSATISSLSSR